MIFYIILRMDCPFHLSSDVSHDLPSLRKFQRVKDLYEMYVTRVVESFERSLPCNFNFSKSEKDDQRSLER